MAYDEFKVIATYYDDLYVKPDQYREESMQVCRFFEDHRNSDGNRLLDVACGTGGHLAYLRERYQVSGLDLSEDMLAVARRKFPDIPFHQADMIDFSLGMRFDAIICMYGSIGFVRTRPNLKRAVGTMVKHLVPGGILVIVPWSTRGAFGETIVVDAVKHPLVKLARMENVKRKSPTTAEVTLHHLVGRDGQVTYHTQTAEVGLFSRDEYASSIQQAGADVVETYEGPAIKLGAFVGRRRGP